MSREWWYGRDGQNVGPLTLEELQAHLALSPGTLVWREGWPGWKAAGEVAEVASTPPVVPEYRACWIEGDKGSGSGFCLQRLSDGQRLSWHRLPKKSKVRAVNLVGEKYRSGHIQSRDFLPSLPLRLVREPDNPHDPNAVAVWNYSYTHQAGYIPRDEAREIAAAMDGGTAFRCYSMWQVVRKRRREELRILLVEPSASMMMPADPGAPLPVAREGEDAAKGCLVALLTFGLAT